MNISLKKRPSNIISDAPVRADQIRVIEPKHGWRLIDFRELIEYRDLFYFLVSRDIKVKYAQSVLGVGWAVAQPLFMMIVFSVVFGRLVNVDSDGVPYPIFSYTALVPWTYFSTGLSDSTDSLIKNANMLSKVYFPRLTMPLAAVFAKLVDFSIAMVLVFVLMLWYRVTPTIWVSALPLLIIIMMLTVAGLGMWFTALAIQYRDVKYGLTLVVQLLMYGSPVVYPTSLIPDQYRIFYALNPMVGVIEGMRAALLGTISMPWELITISGVAAIFLAISGALYFRRTERVFADVA